MYCWIRKYNSGSENTISDPEGKPGPNYAFRRPEVKQCWPPEQETFVSDEFACCCGSGSLATQDSDARPLQTIAMQDRFGQTAKQTVGPQQHRRTGFDLHVGQGRQANKTAKHFRTVRQRSANNKNANVPTKNERSRSNIHGIACILYNTHNLGRDARPHPKHKET